MTEAAKVHLLPKAQIADAAKILRLIADEIDKGEYGEIATGGIVLRNKKRTLHVFSCGDTSNDKAISLFTRAIHFLVG